MAEAVDAADVALRILVDRPFIEAAGASSTVGLSRPLPAIECPTVRLAIATVAGSDAVMLAALGMMKHELAAGRVLPVFHESWLRSRWAFMKLRHRSPDPAAMAFLSALRAAHAAAVAETAMLDKRWRQLRPTAAAASSRTAPARRDKPRG